MVTTQASLDSISAIITIAGTIMSLTMATLTLLTFRLKGLK
jgi:hypothetical protein